MIGAQPQCAKTTNTAFTLNCTDLLFFSNSSNKYYNKSIQTVKNPYLCGIKAQRVDSPD